MTIRQQIRDAAIEALNTNRPTDVPEAGKRRWTPGQKITAPRLAAFFGEEDVQQPQGRSGPLAKRYLILVLQAVAVVEDPAEADDAIEPILAHIVDVMGDTNLNGLALSITEIATLWATGESSVFVIAALSRWRIEYQTLRDDLNAKQ
jgi:hypothetical protein